MILRSRLGSYGALGRLSAQASSSDPIQYAAPGTFKTLRFRYWCLNEQQGSYSDTPPRRKCVTTKYLYELWGDGRVLRYNRTQGIRTTSRYDHEKTRPGAGTAQEAEIKFDTSAGAGIKISRPSDGSRPSNTGTGKTPFSPPSSKEDKKPAKPAPPVPPVPPILPDTVIPPIIPPTVKPVTKKSAVPAIVATAAGLFLLSHIL